MWSGEAEREDCSNHKGSQLILRGGRVIKDMVTAFLRMKCNIGPIKKVEVVRTQLGHKNVDRMSEGNSRWTTDIIKGP